MVKGVPRPHTGVSLARITTVDDDIVTVFTSKFYFTTIAIAITMDSWTKSTARLSTQRSISKQN